MPVSDHLTARDVVGLLRSGNGKGPEHPSDVPALYEELPKSPIGSKRANGAAKLFQCVEAVMAQGSTPYAGAQSALEAIARGAVKEAPRMISAEHAKKIAMDLPMMNVAL